MITRPPSLTRCIETKDTWPCWPVLPIKNAKGIEPGHFPRFGVLVDCGDDGIRFVVDVNIFDREAIVEKLDAAPTADITTLEAEGWVVD